MLLLLPPTALREAKSGRTIEGVEMERVTKVPETFHLVG